jgi:hypothetical protein
MSTNILRNIHILVMQVTNKSLSRVIWRGIKIFLQGTCIRLWNVCKLLSQQGVLKGHQAYIWGQFQNQTLIVWLKKYKIENKSLLYGTVTYITALLLHIVVIHI